MPGPEQPTRLDPDRAIEQARGTPAAPTPGPGGTSESPSRRPPPPAIDTRRYQWMIGGFGLVLVIVFSFVLYVSGGNGTPGVAAGQRLHRFVAPLATSDLNLPANGHPVCNPAHPARHGLNVCDRTPIVLAFFAADAGPCVRTVDALQVVSRRYPTLQFAAVALDAGRAETARLVRRHGWTIPVAFDLTGAIGQIYGISVCPILELAAPGGIVKRRLIGEAWGDPAALARAVARFAAQLGPTGQLGGAG